MVGITMKSLSKEVRLNESNSLFLRVLCYGSRPCMPSSSTRDIQLLSLLVCHAGERFLYGAFAVVYW